MFKKEHPLYNTWRSMRDRCLNKNKDSYPYYGGRGISISSDFGDFWEYVSYVESLPNYKKRRENNLTLDRIDNEGNYEKGNLKWANRTQQVMNRKNVLKLEQEEVGKKYGMLKVLRVFHKNGKGLCMVECICDCGSLSTRTLHSIRHAKVKSCGCYNLGSVPGRGHKKHGKSETKIYETWKTMRRNNINEITTSWSDFDNFYKDMGEKPEKHCLRRKDTNKKFCKINCYWQPYGKRN